MESLESKNDLSIRIEDGECPLKAARKCLHSWYDFTSSGMNGDKMDDNCPMRVAITSGVYSKETTAFIIQVLAMAQGYHEYVEEE